MGIVGNAKSFLTGQKNVATAGVAETVVAASTPIPEGYEVTVQAKEGNTGIIYLAESAAKAQDPTQAKTMKKTDSVTLRVDDLVKIWIDSSVDGEGVEYIVER